MRRSLTIAEPLHKWIQQIRAAYLSENNYDLSYTAAINYYIAFGLYAVTRLVEKKEYGKFAEECKNFADQVFYSEEISIASIQDEIDNEWLARELPKIIEKVQKKENKKDTPT